MPYSAGVMQGHVDTMSTSPRTAPGSRWRAYAGAAGVCIGAAGLAWPLEPMLDTVSLALVFIVAVVLAAARFGRGPATLAAGLSVLLLNMLFVPPRLSLAVSEERFYFTFGVMLVVGLLVGQLTAGLRAQAQAAADRERRVRSLYDLSRELGTAIAPQQVFDAAARFAGSQLGATTALWVRNRLDVLEHVGGSVDEPLAARARLALQREVAAQPVVDDPAGQVLVLALRATMAVRGVLAIRRLSVRPWVQEERRLLDTCTSLLAGALERIHYIEVAQASAVEIADERLRNSLLSAISHDLRTPLASLVGLAESLQLTRPAPTTQQAEVAAAMAATARRMSALVGKLLDMARLEAGTERLDLQWQPIEEVVGAALAAMAVPLRQRPVSVDLPQDLPLVRFDAVLIERVLVNLLENAVKYSPDDSAIELAACVDGDSLVLSVRDHGPGVPAARRTAMFRKFERGTRESATPGVGLGLALCRAILEAHAGRIELADAPGGGTRVLVGLPLGTPPAMPGHEDPTEARADDRADQASA